jgi:hypothetical protein
LGTDCIYGAMEQVINILISATRSDACGEPFVGAKKGPAPQSLVIRKRAKSL